MMQIHKEHCIECFRSCYLNKQWFGYISVSTINLLGQHWQNQQVSKCTLKKLERETCQTYCFSLMTEYNFLEAKTCQPEFDLITCPGTFVIQCQVHKSYTSWHISWKFQYIYLQIWWSCSWTDRARGQVCMYNRTIVISNQMWVYIFHC